MNINFCLIGIEPQTSRLYVIKYSKKNSSKRNKNLSYIKYTEHNFVLVIVIVCVCVFVRIKDGTRTNAIIYVCAHLYMSQGNGKPGRWGSQRDDDTTTTTTTTSMMMMAMLDSGLRNVFVFLKPFHHNGAGFSFIFYFIFFVTVGWVDSMRGSRKIIRLTIAHTFSKET